MSTSASSNLNAHASGTRLGSYLVEAGLITPAQVLVVLNDQQIGSNMRFGEVLVARGWIKAETVEFIMTRVVEPERRAIHDRNLAESLTESQKQTQPSRAYPSQTRPSQTRPSQTQQTPSAAVNRSTDRLSPAAARPTQQASKVAPPPYPTTPPVVARARSLDGDFEVEIFDSLADTSSLDPNSSGASQTNVRRNDRKSLPSVSEDGGVKWAG